jgi:hypothetical protein
LAKEADEVKIEILDPAGEVIQTFVTEEVEKKKQKLMRLGQWHWKVKKEKKEKKWRRRKPLQRKDQGSLNKPGP